MNGSKAKKLRRFVKKNFTEMPDREYTVEYLKNAQMQPRSVLKLIGSCKRKIYQELKKSTTNLALA